MAYIDAVSVNSTRYDVQDTAAQIMALLHDDVINDTVQTITYDSSGAVQSITHSRNNVVVRTDTFAISTSQVVETRTLASGEILTMTTNLSTLVTTVAYTAA